MNNREKTAANVEHRERERARAATSNVAWNNQRKKLNDIQKHAYSPAN